MLNMYPAWNVQSVLQSQEIWLNTLPKSVSNYLQLTGREEEAMPENIKKRGYSAPAPQFQKDLELSDLESCIFWCGKQTWWAASYHWRVPVFFCYISSELFLFFLSSLGTTLNFSFYILVQGLQEQLGSYSWSVPFSGTLVCVLSPIYSQRPLCIFHKWLFTLLSTRAPIIKTVSAN